MVVWLRKNQEGVAVPDGLIRRSALADVIALDAAFDVMAERQAETLAQAERDAQAIVDSANEYAQQVRAQAEQDAQDLFEQARSQGRQAGIEEWTQTALTSARDAHEQMRQQRERMARIVIAAVEKIIPLQDPQGIYRQVLKMLSKSMQAVRYVTVRVFPDELTYAETSLRELSAGTALGKLIEVVGDDRLLPGACLVETDQGIIDLSLDSQMKALRAAITMSIGQRNAPATDDRSEA